jgi:hypothetical protein
MVDAGASLTWMFSQSINQLIFFCILGDGGKSLVVIFFLSFQRIYNCSEPYDPEGILGTLMTILLCILGLQVLGEKSTEIFWDLNYFQVFIL